jgi:hypothetical protein
MGIEMTGKKTELSIAGQSFESLKKANEHGAEYWSARDLQPLLGYSQWRRFEQTIDRAISSCKQSGNLPENHFADAGKMVDIGSGSVRDINDYHLSRFACYLIAQNGDPRKPEIANAQKYFAIQTHEQVGREVRQAIQRIGGTLPENIPPAEHIKAVEKRLKSAAPKLALDDRDAKGLLGKKENEDE